MPDAGCVVRAACGRGQGGAVCIPQTQREPRDASGVPIMQMTSTAPLSPLTPPMPLKITIPGVQTRGGTVPPTTPILFLILPRKVVICLTRVVLGLGVTACVDGVPGCGTCAVCYPDAGDRG